MLALYKLKIAWQHYVIDERRDSRRLPNIRRRNIDFTVFIAHRSPSGPIAFPKKMPKLY